MNIRIKIQSIPFILLAFVMSGCAGGCNRGYVSEHSLQGKELKAILEESRKIDVATPADWPIQFDSVAIDKKTDTEKVSYRAVLVWRLTGLQDVVRPQLQKLMKNHSPTEELPEWEATRLEVQLQFKNQNGEAVGKQSGSSRRR